MSKSSFLTALVAQLTTAILGVLVSFGINMTADQMAAIVTLVGVVGTMGTLLLWARTVPREKVLEALVGDAVVAGPANDMAADGTVVRRIEPRRAVPADGDPENVPIHD